MKVLAFDSPSGCFHFQLQEIESQLHAHPAHEIIIAESGDFRLVTPQGAYQRLRVACISAHIPHALKASSGTYRIIMLESREEYWHDLLDSHGITLNQGIYASPNQLLSKISFPTNPLPQSSHPVIHTCLRYFHQKPGRYEDLMEDLQEKTHLSASRLSHIFKAEMGISLKKYAVGNRLKYAFRLFMEGREKTLTGIALESGFFDSAHISRAFKQMLGMSPSDQYKSRMIQD